MVTNMETKTTKYVGYHDEQDLPVKRGQTVTIPKGTTVKTVGRPAKQAGKTYKVKVDHILPGTSDYSIAVQDKKVIEVRTPRTNPKVVWAGPGGYWSEADINDVIV
jgi:hypothetical protein